MSSPKTTDAWIIQDTKGFDSLVLKKDVPIPELGDHDVLVQIEAVSLNYRDLIIPQGKYPFPMSLPRVACSDGAGKVISVGKSVNEFSAGDRVCTLFNQGHQAGPLTPEIAGTGLGGAVDGTLRQYGVFPDHGLVVAPPILTAIEAGTLTCAPLTAWNALYGLQSKALKAGDIVVTQGTGGVALSAIQFARAAGAVVIATTSTNEKAEFLKELGASHVINYKEDKAWGETAKDLSPGKEGADHVIEVGGPNTMEQSMKAIKPEGVISVIGFLGGGGENNQPSTLDALTNMCTVRGLLVGSKAQFVDMNRSINANNIHPVVDKKIFSFEDAKSAYEYQWSQRHLGNVVIQLGER